MNILGNVVEHYVLLSAIIFTIGGIGFLVRRNVLVQRTVKGSVFLRDFADLVTDVAGRLDA